MRTLILLLLPLLLTGCFYVTNRITPDDPDVQPLTIGRDCILFLPGMGYGLNTVERAMANADPPVKKIRSISIDTRVGLVFGQQCLTVVGEPDSRGLATSPQVTP